MVDVNSVLRFSKTTKLYSRLITRNLFFYLEIFGHYRPGVRCRRLLRTLKYAEKNCVYDLLYQTFVRTSVRDLLHSVVLLMVSYCSPFTVFTFWWVPKLTYSRTFKNEQLHCGNHNENETIFTKTEKLINTGFRISYRIRV